MDSNGLKLPVSECDKMEGSVLGCRFGDKAEHLPIKKRRFLFRVSSPPPPNTTSSEGNESVAACLHSSSQEVQPKPDASCPTAASPTVADLPQTGSTGSIDSKVDEEKLVMASKKTSEDEDICGTSLVDHAACSNDLGVDSDLVSNDMKSPEAPGTVKIEPDSVKLANVSATETDLHLSTAPLKDIASSIMDCSPQDKATMDKSTPDKFTLENPCSHAPPESEMNKVTSKMDDRSNWDLNTEMDEWGKPLERDHNINTADAACSNITYAEGKDSCKEGNSESCELSENIVNEKLPVELKSLTPKIEESELEECKPLCNGINKLLSHVQNSAPHVAVNNIKSLHSQQVDTSTDAIPISVPSTLALNYPACDISTKHVNVNGTGTDDLSRPMAAGTGFSLDYSMPRAFDHSKENVVSSKIVGPVNNVNHAITTLQTTENEKLNLSLVTAASLENEVHPSESSYDEDDKTKVKRVITRNGITMENLIAKGTGTSQDSYTGNCEAVNPTNIGSLLVVQSSVLAEGKDQPAAVSSMHTEVPIKTETINHISHESHTDCPNDPVSYNKEICKVPLDNAVGYENYPSDIQAGSEVDNIDEVSFGYDSQFEDGEMRESSMQTWEGYEGEDRENEHGTDNRVNSFHETGSLCAPESSSRVRSTDEISSVLLPEKLDSSDQISGSEPNETENATREVSINRKNTSESDQWKMNVSGSDPLPEIHSTSSNITKMRDLTTIKASSSIGREDLETKAEGSRIFRGEPPTRDTFSNRGRLQMQGCSSSNGDDSPSRSVREPGVVRSFRQGKYTPQVHGSGRGGGTWNRSPGRDSLTNEVGASYVPRQSFKSRLLINRDEDDFRARLGLRPSGDTCHTRFVNVGRGRSPRYDSRNTTGGPRGRYYGPANDDFDEPSLEHSHSFPTRRRCFSPTIHHSGSTSPPRSPISDGFRRRSRSPNRIRRPRSPNYRHGFEPDQMGSGYNLEPRDNNSRWVKYKQQSSVFERRSPPPIGDRLTFYDPSRRTKQNETYRSGPPERFSEARGGGRGGPRYLETDNGYRRGDGLVRRYETGRPVKHIQYDGEDGYGPPVYDSRDKEGLEFHGRGNPKPFGNGLDSRFRDLPRRPREERDNW